MVQVSGLLEREGSVVAGQVADSPDEHFAKRGVNVEEEGPVDVPGAHLAEVSLVPADPRRLVDLVEPGP